jgi:3',5'-cyclic AMP phosphodiesterase CpdA
LFILAQSLFAVAQIKPFRFTFISDKHIGSPDGKAEEDLRRTVQDINELKDVTFVIITGDITELGTDALSQLAKKLLDSFNIQYYIIPGNHDNCGLSFTRVFGDYKFLLAVPPALMFV